MGSTSRGGVSRQVVRMNGRNLILLINIADPALGGLIVDQIFRTAAAAAARMSM